MDEIGIVKSVDGVTAKVIFSRKSSCCESCEKETCDIPEDGIETEAINAAGAKVGQRVKVVMRSYTFVKGAMVIYVLPVFALIAGAILGKIYLPLFWGGVDSDLLAALAGFLTLFASLILVKIISNRMDKKTENKSVIESIIKE